MTTREEIERKAGAHGLLLTIMRGTRPLEHYIFADGQDVVFVAWGTHGAEAFLAGIEWARKC